MKNNNHSLPPLAAIRFLRWFLRDDLAEEVQGDLEEKFYSAVKKKSLLRARLNYWFQVLNYLRPFAIKTFSENTTTYNQMAMFNNYVKSGWRIMRKNNVFSSINIVGLATGMAACLLILQYVGFEKSYDNFRRSGIYRVVESGYQNGQNVGHRAQSSPALTPAFRENIPEVNRAARLVHTAPLMPEPVIQSGDRTFHEEKIYFADPSFPVMFSYGMKEGDDMTALSEPNSVMISASMERKYFHDEPALGKILTFFQGDRGKVQLKVTGVFYDIPENSHVHTDFLVSFSTLPWNLDNEWGWGNFYNYIEVTPGTDPELIIKKIEEVHQKYQGPLLAEWKQGGYVRKFEIQQIQDIHLDSHLEAEVETNGNRRTVSFLSIIAVFILIIAWVNYLNLTTAKSIERAREIGIRKVVGSHRRQLILQFLTESLMVNMSAGVLALLFSQLARPAFGMLFQGHFTSVFNLGSSLSIAGLFLAGTFLSAIYPAVILSGYRPVQVLKGKIKSSASGIGLRKGLVIFQFAVSIALITGTFVVRRQLHYMQQQDLGLNINQTLILRGPGIKDSTSNRRQEYFKNSIEGLPVVQACAYSSSIPGKELSWGRPFYLPAYPANRHGLNIIAVDEEFFSLFDATFLAGRNFSKEMSSDRDGVIMNETAMRLMGFKTAGDAIGEKIIWDESYNDQQSKIIIGITRDYNQESLHKKVGPVVFALKKYLNAPWAGEFYSLKMNTDNYPEALDEVKESWEAAFPNSPFNYFFLDDFFNAQYQSDRQFATLFSIFSGLAILIAYLGLFGLIATISLQRTKEIGIRKVLGATTRSVLTLMSGDFIRPVVIAAVIILPVMYIAAGKWLENFAYQMDIHWWLFLLPVLLVISVSLIAILAQTFRAALLNPVDTLKYE